MIFPLNINIGNMVIPIHLLTTILAFVVAGAYYLKLRSKIGDNVSTLSRLDLIIGAFIGALIGSRILASFEDVSYTISNLSIMAIFSQQTIVGGIVGGIIGVEITKKIKSIKTATGDLYVFPIILGVMIGRVGCFLTGVADRTVGLPCSLPWCFAQGDGIVRHPTALYEIIFLIILWLILYQIKKKVSLDAGVLFRFFIIGYSIFRLLIEFIKPHGTIFLGYSSIQIACLVSAVFFITQLLIKHRNKQKTLSKL